MRAVPMLEECLEEYLCLPVEDEEGGDDHDSFSLRPF